MSRSIRLALNGATGGGLLLMLAAPAMAQGSAPAGPTDFAQLLPAALILLLPLGLILLISSAMPELKAPAAAINLLVVWAVAVLAYFGAGFAFHFGGIAQVSPHPDLTGLYWEWYPLDQSVEVEVARLWGVIALQGWGLSGVAAQPGVLLLFLSHASLVGAAALIPAGVLLWRDQAAAAVATSLFVGLLLYPAAGNWLWGGGWLSNIGASLGLGHGLVDFGGAGPVFLLGSGAALAGLFAFREQTVAVSSDGSALPEQSFTESPAETDLLDATPMPSAYLPILSVLGAGLMLLGWAGLSAGVHNPTALNFSGVQTLTGGLLAALTATVTTAAYSWFTTGQFNPLMTGRGLAAGLVVAMAGAPFMPIWAATAGGAATGLLLPFLIYWLDQKLPLQDSLGTVATFGLSSLLSLLLVGFFADGRAGQGWNRIGPAAYAGVDGQGVSGLVVSSGFASDWPGQLQAQLLGLAVLLVWSVVLSAVFFQIYLSLARAWQRTKTEQQPQAVPPQFEPPPTPELPEENLSASQKLTSQN